MFELSKSFVDEYRQRPVAFGWNGLGEVAFYRTYSRKDNPRATGMEGWADVCERCINGMYQFQQTWCQATGVNWNTEKAERSAKEAFDLMFHFKWSPPGRGLWMAGTDFIMQRGVVEALQNCAFISSEYIAKERGDFFRWLMEMSMLGVGVGFDTRGAGKIAVQRPLRISVMTYTIPDTRQGWARSVELLIDSYLNATSAIVFDYNQIRPRGAPIYGFGGVASGPAPLIELHKSIRSILDTKSGCSMDSRTIVDLCNLIGKCVVAGNVRRSAEIAFGAPTDNQFVNLKNYEQNPERKDFGWVSNNSIFAEVGMDYTDVAQRTYENGEPGYFWLENARQYGRMDGLRNFADSEAMGANPCVEQVLHHREMCTLVEIYLPRCKSKREFERAIKYAYLYGKSTTLASDQISDPQTRTVMQRNRRIGLSVTGITQFAGAHGLEILRDWLDHGHHITGYYDRLYSQWLDCNESIRRNSVKPGGTVPLLAGCTPGVHFNIANRFHIRRMIIADDSPLIDPLRAAGYPMEASAYTPDSLSVSFPVDAGPGVRSESEVSMKEQLDLVAMVQRHWADNAVSATVKFDRRNTTPHDIKEALEKYQYSLKGISFLPAEGHGYTQAPYESITAGDYEQMMSRITPMSITDIGQADKQVELYCEGDACKVVS